MGATTAPYSQQEIETALLEIALQGGALETARKSLVKKQADLGLERVPDRKTLRDWRDKDHPERYQAIRDEEAPRIRQRMADQNAALAEKLIEAEHEALDLSIEAMHNGDLDAKDIVNLGRNLATSKGIAVDKYDRLSDPNPGMAGSLRTAAELIGSLARLGVVAAPEPPQADYEGEAVEEPAAEITR